MTKKAVCKHPPMDIGGGMILRYDEVPKYEFCEWEDMGLKKEEIIFIRSFHKLGIHKSWDYLDVVLAMCGWDTFWNFDPDSLRLKSVRSDGSLKDGCIFRSEWEQKRFKSIRPSMPVKD
jgi:hypothetical protein